MINKIQKGKRALIAISIIVIVFAALMLGGGVVLTVFGAKAIAESASLVTIILEMAFGVILILLGLIGIVMGIIMVWTGGAIKAIHGNIAEGNLGKGTVNMTKCQNCGNEVNQNEEFCTVCGKSLKSVKVCPKCKTENKQNAKHCSKCGEDL